MSAKKTGRKDQRTRGFLLTRYWRIDFQQVGFSSEYL